MKSQGKLEEAHMKFTKCLLTVSAALAGMVLVVDLPLHAQSLAMKVTIPFEFHAANKTLPAGTYIVERRGDAIVISDGKGSIAAALANPVANKAYKVDDMVVFNRYGDTRFLSEVRWRGYSTARGLRETPAEHKLAKLVPAEPISLVASR
jgi:hypothetical protein